MEITDIKSKYGKVYIKHKKNGLTYNETIEGFPWYFYSDPLEPQHLKIVQKYARSITKHQGLLKISCDNDSLNKWDLEKGKLDNKTIIIKYLLDHKIKTYEADIDLWKRWLLDSNHTISKSPSLCFIDIETDDSHDGIMIGRDQILSFSACIDGKAWFYCDDDEKKVLLKIKSLFNKVDIVIGWNSLNFDVPYILARFERHGIQFWKQDLIHFDLMEIFKKRYKFSDQEPITNFNLENISQMFLGKGKVKHSEKIKWLYDNDRVRLKEYNNQDTLLLHELNEKLGIMELIIGVCSESRTPFRNYYVSELVDNYVLQEAKKLGRILPSNMWKIEMREGESEKGKYEGAIVFDPILGLHDNVTVLDYNSMYPNMMITFNIGIDTWVKEPTEEEKVTLIRTPNGCFFRKDIESINAIVAKKLLSERQKAKDEMKLHPKDSIPYKAALNKSEVIKVLANSQYGAVGSSFTRFHSNECSEAITLSAQYILKFSQTVFTQNGKSILAGDTDSVFVKSL